MHGYRKSPHDKMQRRIVLGVIIFAVIVAIIAVPLIVNDELRYELTMQTGQIPGDDVEKLAEGDAGALLIVIPLEHEIPDIPTPWLFRAQFIAWPVIDGIKLENLESGEATHLPLEQVDFIAANGDGSLVLIRGNNAVSGEPIAVTVEPESMKVELLASVGEVPDVPGDWETSIWEKQGQRCHRPSPHLSFLICFVNAELNSYFAGDWELNLQIWGDYKEQHPIFRGMGFLPITGFSQNDSLIYSQNENGLWRAEVPPDLLQSESDARLIATPHP